MTSGMPSMSATSAPCSGPAPPNATSAKSRGSMPFCTVRERMALAMLLLMTVSTPSAASSFVRPSARPAPRSRDARASSSSFMLPPRKSSLSRRPSTTLASVTVGSRAAAAVGGRAGHRAGAARSDAEGAAVIDIGDRAAAGADRVDVDHRHQQRESRRSRCCADRSRQSGRRRRCRYRRWCRRCRR